jgi:hypothetical protein
MPASAASRSTPVSKSKGTSDEGIGRPKEWREGRYQQPGKPVDDTVETGTETPDVPAGSNGVPVTKEDYEQR